jgi:sialate O-acetylesterase
MQARDSGDEAQAEPASRRMPALLQPVEAAQHRLALGLRDAGPRIAHVHARGRTDRAGRNVIALGVFGGAGPLLPGSQMTLTLADGVTLPLAGQWRYRTSASMSQTGQIPHVPWQNQFGLTVLHDGMIAPLGPTRVRGIIWYQGESDANQPNVYARLLPAMMGDWRRQFGRRTRFLILQLPGFGDYQTQPEPSDWAQLREV